MNFSQEVFSSTHRMTVVCHPYDYCVSYIVSYLTVYYLSLGQMYAILKLDQGFLRSYHKAYY